MNQADHAKIGGPNGRERPETAGSGGDIVTVQVYCRPGGRNMWDNGVS